MDEPNGPRLVASEGEAVADAPPGLLASIKDDLNIPAIDNTQDAWLQRRIDNIWARFEKYCCRALPVPPAKFIDDWSLIAERSNHVEPPLLDYWPAGSPFLRYCPVVTIDGIEFHGSAGDPTKVLFEPASGKLFSLDGIWSHDVSYGLRGRLVKIHYTAGWATCPGDLYEALLGCIVPLWQARSLQLAGGLGGGASRINIVDVGQIDLSPSSPFVASAASSSASSDPLIGPWVTLLDSYVDARVQMGSPLIPTTTAV